MTFRPNFGHFQVNVTMNIYMLVRSINFFGNVNKQSEHTKRKNN